MIDRGDTHGGGVADRERVVSRCHSTVLLEQVDAALDGVPLLVVLSVEDRWATTGRALLLPIRDLVGLARDRRPDPSRAQVGTVGGTAVRLVRQYRIRAAARSTTTASRHPNRVEHGRELRTVTALTCSDDE